MVEFSLYSMGSGTLLHAVFNGLAMITATEDFRAFVSCGMLIGIFAICIQSLLKGAGSIAWQNILLGYLLYMCLFAVPSRAIIEDIHTGDMYTVDNVPIGASAMGAIVSRIGYGITELFETGYGSESRITQMPYMSTLHYVLAAEDETTKSDFFEALDQATKIRVKPTVREYVINCIIPKLNNLNYTADTLRTMKITSVLEIGSEDKANAIAIYKQGGTQEVQSCADALSTINKSIVPYLTGEQFKKILEKSLDGQSASTIGSGYSYLDAFDLSDALSALGASSLTAQDFMLTSIMTPIMAQAYSRHYSREGLMADTMIAQASSQRNIQWTAEQEMWSRVAHPFMAFFEALFYSITPFMAVLFCMGTFGVGLLGRYVTTLLWINLWMPIMSVCNLYVTYAAEGKIKSLEKALAVIDSSLDSIYGLHTMISYVQDQVAVGGMLAAATPIIALVILTGSIYPLTTLASRLNGADHIDERLVRPDIAKAGAGLSVAPAYQEDLSAGLLQTGSQPTFSRIDLGQITTKSLSSAAQRMLKVSNSYMRSVISEAKSGSSVFNTKEFASSLRHQLDEQHIGKDAEQREQITRSIVSGKVDLGAGINTGIKLGGSVTDQYGKDKGIKLTSSETQQLSKAIATAQTSTTTSAAQSFSGSSTAVQTRKTAMEVLSASKSFTEASTQANLLGATRSMATNVMANIRNDATEERILSAVNSSEHGPAIKKLAANLMDRQRGMSEDHAIRTAYYEHMFNSPYATDAMRKEAVTTLSYGLTGAGAPIVSTGGAGAFSGTASPAGGAGRGGAAPGASQGGGAEAANREPSLFPEGVGGKPTEGFSMEKGEFNVGTSSPGKVMVEGYEAGKGAVVKGTKGAARVIGSGIDNRIKEGQTREQSVNPNEAHPGY